MANVPKHYTEEERKGHAGEHCRVYFFVGRNSVCVHDFLKRTCEVVSLEVGGRGLVFWEGF